jgi:hypothetical protein
VSRYPSAQQIVVLVAALVVGSGSFVALRAGEPGSDAVERTAAEGLANVADGVQPIAFGGDVTGLALPTPSADAAAATAEAAAGDPAAPAAEAPATTAGQQQAQQQQQQQQNNQQQPKEEKLQIHEAHNYLQYAVSTLGAQMLAPDQAPYSGYTKVAPTQIQAKSTITGLWPVIEQAISDVKANDRNVRGEELEHRIAKRLTELNDWDNLTRQTKAKVQILSGLDIESMNDQEREIRVNQYLHSVMPFGDIDEVLSSDTTIDLGYTHTLDKSWTQVADVGNGVFKITMLSNNNNGAHTTHSLGSFKVQMAPGTSLKVAKQVGNDMVVAENNNDRLNLDASAKNVLYGVTPPLDFSKPIVVTTTTMAPETTTTAAAVTTASTAPGSSTTAPASSSTSAPAATTTSTTAASSSSSGSTP